MSRTPSFFTAIIGAALLASCAAPQREPAPVPAPPPAPVPAAPVPRPAPPPPAATGSFAEWLARYRTAALARGVAPATLDALFNGMVPSDRVIELDRAQPGDSGGAPARFDNYLARRLDASRINGGKAALDRSTAPLAKALATSGVPAGVIIGVWGMETSYGRVTGDFDVVRSLATLAWEGRRRALFTKELDAVVDIIDQKRATRAQLIGSWAGAMGQPQFLPSSYLAYAADGDGDGRSDIWGSEADTIASIGNYLARHGWQAGIGWGFAVQVPAGFDRAAVRNPVAPTTCVRPLERHSKWLPASEWQRMGLTTTGSWPAPATPMSLVEPDGPGQGAWLTTGNYRAILGYNCSNFYALSVALLGDAVAGPQH
ncbi:lytic murein transglycosylase [Polymorphobacter fuscus]|uniref:Lytic murein transglycosylase n=1 Tax=Sandarakinorhabdus fusca TaxID=1439888 RepID=A0A7C9KGN5_9SPHN|nr:lytic murein transglycosylase [Polymorphobacter fuscus]KAB7648680.1 lytic murein transglycosylase [Polymorphobacter fuscus]MQT16240.1 lytic murein transglycosylase [Polymorphobacter fuscus]NJC07475.1 lytic murein transglycosylase [Polymorphobacter fuscus]